MKTASRILMTFALLAFFSGMTFSQDVQTSKPASPGAKSEVAVPAKNVDQTKNAGCVNHGGKQACAPGKNFVDKNSDGKCDNCGSGSNCKGTGSGCGKGHGCGSSCGSGSGCGKGQGAGNCGGQGHQHQNGCSKQAKCSPASQPNK
jgi:hypothetical protein